MYTYTLNGKSSEMRPLHLLAICSLLFLSCKKKKIEEEIAPPIQYDVTHYYVSPAGNDANDGKSADKPFKTIQKAADLAQPRCTVHLAGGEYKQQLEMKTSGTDAYPIVFIAEPSDPSMPAVLTQGGENDAVLTIIDKRNIRIQGLHVANLTRNNAQGILIKATPDGGVSNIQLREVNVYNIAWTAQPAKTPGENDNAQPIIVYGEGKAQQNAVSGVYFYKCKVYNNVTGYSEAISLDGNIDNFSVTSCEVYNNTNIGIAAIGNYGVSATAALDQARNGRISDNYCHDNIASYATSAGIYVDGGSKISIFRNRCKNNGYGIEVGCEENGSASDIYLLGNVIEGNQEAGMALGGYDAGTSGQVKKCLVVNNTFFRNGIAGGGGELAITKASDCKIMNNIFYGGTSLLLYGEAISPQQNNTFDYNSWFTTVAGGPLFTWAGKNYNTFDAWQNGTKQDLSSMNFDPKLVNVQNGNVDLHLQAGSGLRKKGNEPIIWLTFPTDVAEKDLDGESFGAEFPNIGAYQK